MKEHYATICKTSTQYVHFITEHRKADDLMTFLNFMIKFT